MDSKPRSASSSKVWNKYDKEEAERLAPIYPHIVGIVLVSIFALFVGAVAIFTLLTFGVSAKKSTCDQSGEVKQIEGMENFNTPYANE